MAGMSSFWQSCTLSFVGSSVVFLTSLQLALRPWKQAQGQHWTERARLLWPARQVQLGTLLACVLTQLAGAVLDPKHVFVPELSLVGIFGGYLVGNYFFMRTIEPRYRFPIWFMETFWRFAIQFGVFGILGYLLATMPHTLHAADWLRVGVGLAAAFTLATGVWLPLFKLFPRKPKPHEERLNQMVQEVATETGVTPRWVFYGRTPQAQAAALVFLRSLVISTRLMEELDDAELRSVLHHETAHLKEGWGVSFSRLLPLAGFVPFIFVEPLLHYWGSQSLLLLFLFPFLALRLARWISRKMENRADAAALESVAEPAVYARALEKLYRANQLPAVMRNNRLAHPHLYARMLSAGVTPDYPRPARPGMMAWPGLASFLLPLALTSYLLMQPESLRHPAPTQKARTVRPISRR